MHHCMGVVCGQTVVNRIPVSMLCSLEERSFSILSQSTLLMLLVTYHPGPTPPIGLVFAATLLKIGTNLVVIANGLANRISNTFRLINNIGVERYSLAV
jgi:hypothetical protein